MAQAPTKSDRPTPAEFLTEPTPHLECGHCHGLIDDDVNDCPTCLTPINWPMSNDALNAYWASTAD
jgi:hypothetical protein